VVDYSLPLINGIELTRQIRRRLPRTEVLIFTMHDNEELIGELLRAGARGFLLKSDAKHHLLEAIETIAAHTSFFTYRVSETLLKSFLLKSSRSQSILTPREREIVQLVAEGHSNKKIAGILNLNLKKVEAHRAAIMRKLNLSSWAELVRYAVRNKLVGR
jgi:DNA-binding NarL/FixJ family response regulator